MPQNSVIVIIESWGQIGQHALYRPLGSHVRLGQAANFECNGWSYNVIFRVRQRGSTGVGDRERQPGAFRLDQARHLLASVRSSLAGRNFDLEADSARQDFEDPPGEREHLAALVW